MTDKDFIGQLQNRPRGRLSAYNSSDVALGLLWALKAGSNITLTMGTDGKLTIASSGGGSGHTIRENGTDQTARTGLNVVDTDAGAGLITDDAINDETELNLNLYILKSLLTTRGDIIYRNATAPARLAVGTQYKVVTSDGTDPTYQRHFVWVPVAHWFIGGFLRADTTNHQGAVCRLPDWATAATLVEGSSMRANVSTAPTGADVEIDIKVASTRTGAQTSLFAGGSPDYITIQAGDQDVADAGSDDGTLTTTTLDNQFLFLYVRQAGSTEPGRDLTVDVFAKVWTEY